MGVEDAHADPVPAQSVGNLRDALVRFGPVLDSEGPRAMSSICMTARRRARRAFHLVHGGRCILLRFIQSPYGRAVPHRCPGSASRLRPEVGGRVNAAAATVCEFGLPFNPAPKHSGQFIQITFLISENDGRPLRISGKITPSDPSPWMRAPPTRQGAQGTQGESPREADEHEKSCNR